MDIQTKNLPKNTVELSFVLTMEDVRADLERSAADITEKRPLDGFRPGKAPYDMVKARYGEMAIYENALPAIVRRAYVRAVADAKLRPFGEPDIKVTKLVPGNDLEFTAIITLVPNVTKIADWSKPLVKRKAVEVGDDKVDEAVGQLRRMQTKEVRASHAVGEKDKAVVDMRMSLGGVPLEGGQALGHGIYFAEEYFIPGLKEKLLGASEGETRTFTLPFPADHFKKDLAGKNIDFSVEIKEVYDLIHPELNDEFAKSLGQETMDKLRALIKENLLTEAGDREDARVEMELIDALVEKSSFDEISDIIINQEVERMMHELEHNVEAQGGKFADYLASLKKTEGDVKLDMVSQAIRRIKAALLVRDIGEREKVEADDGEVIAEQQRLLNAHTDTHSQERIRSEEYADHIRTTLRNRKVMEMLRAKGIER